MSKGSILGQQLEVPDNPLTIASNVSYNNSSTSSIITGKNVQTAIDQLFTSVSNGKKKIASAITGKGVSTSANDSFDTMAHNISAINVRKVEINYATADRDLEHGTVSFTSSFTPSNWVIFKSGPGRVSNPKTMFFYAQGYSCFNMNGDSYSYPNVSKSGNTVTISGGDVFGGQYCGVFWS